MVECQAADIAHEIDRNHPIGSPCTNQEPPPPTDMIARPLRDDHFDRMLITGFSSSWFFFFFQL